ncbi:MAG: hypothetical protein V1929_08665 [bacterium]
MEHQKCGQIGLAGMNRDTAAAHIRSGQLPSAQAVDRDWRTRPDPFKANWPATEAMQQDAAVAGYVTASEISLNFAA